MCKSSSKLHKKEAEEISDGRSFLAKLKEEN